MRKYLVHAVGMFEDFKHYHVSFMKITHTSKEVGEEILSNWEVYAETLLHDRTGKSPENVYIVGFNEIDLY